MIKTKKSGYESIFSSKNKSSQYDINSDFEGCKGYLMVLADELNKNWNVNRTKITKKLVKIVEKGEKNMEFAVRKNRSMSNPLDYIFTKDSLWISKKRKFGKKETEILKKKVSSKDISFSKNSFINMRESSPFIDDYSQIFDDKKIKRVNFFKFIKLYFLIC